MKTVTAVQARQGLGRLLNIVQLRHEEIVIERAGKRIARLVPHDADQTETPSRGTGKQDFRHAAGLGRDLWRSVNADDYVESERARWD